ncbi:MAG: hypothetical protein PHC38_13200 [Weeksellaceae bacterium]|nr:hypothetical protein [Weeksellaceae bacterium]
MHINKGVNGIMKNPTITIVSILMVIAGIGLMVFAQCIVKVDHSATFWNYKWAYTVAVFSDGRARTIFLSGIFLSAFGYIGIPLLFKARKKTKKR